MSKVQFGTIVNFLNAKRKPLSSKERENKSGIYPYYGASDIVDYIDEYIFNGTYLLISEDGENLKSRKTPIAFIANGKFWVNNHAHIVEGKDDETIDYLKYYFSQLDLSPYLTGAVQPKLSKGILEKIEIDFPSYEIRKSINQILGLLDQKIQLNTQTNQTLEAIAQAIFKSWFVDFDPVRAKAQAILDGKTSDEANLSAMAVISGKAIEDLSQTEYQELWEIADAFPSELVENAEFGEVPKGWEVRALDEIANYQNGLALQKFRPENDDEFLPVVKIAQLRQGYADGEEKARIDIKSECIIDSGDVVFSWSGSLLVDFWCGGKAALNQHLFKVTSNNYPKWFYYLWTKHHLAEFQRIAADKAVTMGHIKREHLSQALCAIPDDDFLNLCNSISNILDLIIANRIANFDLAKTRDLLLPKLLSGELFNE